MKKNTDPTLHPFQEAREYTRAINAAKLDRMFAKPFVGALSGHIDGVYCMNRHPTDLKLLASGSGDGEIRLWDMAARKCIWSRKKAHDAFIRGNAFLPSTNHLLTCGDDKIVRLWDYAASNSHGSNPEPLRMFQGSGTFTGIDTHRRGHLFATSGSEEVALWDVNRAEPVQTYSWGADTINCVRYNQAETSLLASCASDRSLMIHDTRTNTTLCKVIMAMRSNNVCWNPQEAVYLSVACEDYKVYTFDMRFFDKAVNVLQGHVSAVIDLDYSPTGQEIVTAGYDRSLRIFNAREGHSRDIYHNRRMQRLFCVRYSNDSKYVLSGSDDGNIRIWKAQASEQLGVKNHRQAEALSYNAKLLDKYKHMPEVARIANHRQIPKEIRLRTRIDHEHRQAEKRKEDNRRKHSRPGSVPTKNIRAESILQVKK